MDKICGGEGGLDFDRAWGLGVCAYPSLGDPLDLDHLEGGDIYAFRKDQLYSLA